MDAGRRAQWLRGVLDLCVLGLLAEGESYGYELVRQLETAGLGDIRGGTLYPVLLRLQQAGLVAARWRSGDSGPARKYYRLTANGRTVLRDEAAQWRDFGGRVDAILQGVVT
ncbi:PadR family transcriptional regulator [Yinghuangia sp. ASG 101]|uniref:PadR family transcriptional regulator n=1 Tax=Yinghuangia sp. ASG 101 TaxID=2896848 RepID=UPI001E2C1049|nr:PadR family transcriptional regulator [Yinghuangia sp. ASG 101]UGQ10835.1 PadR family transcriptional regulator [Yinghuangia sp. ASG 101]